jgi:hypothetical protein
MVTGLPSLPLVPQTCDACIMGKQHRHPIPKLSLTSTTKSLELVHSDLCGPLPHKSLIGSRYILTFIDDYTKRSWVYFLATKAETFECFKHFKSLVENKTSLKLSWLCSDKGGEYLSDAFTSYCKLHGIYRQLTAAGTPQQNGLAERKNKHLLETTRSLLFGAGLLPYLWEEVVCIANYLSNCTPTRALYRMTPLEAYTGRKPNLSHLHLFGCAAFLHIQNYTKLEPKYSRMVFVGYDEQSKAYRSFDYTRRKIITLRNVIFDETRLGIPNQADRHSKSPLASVITYRPRSLLVP